MIKKYRKKPIIIKAIQYDGDNKVEIQLFIGKYINDKNGSLPIKTLEGVMFAKKGDYIIKGIKGEFYPCKKDIFEKTYEEAEESKDDSSS